MRLSLNSPVARLVVDIPEEQIMELMRLALDKASGTTPAPVIKTVEKKEVPVTPKPEPKKEVVKTTTPEAKEYSGFLHIKCESCGKFRSFMPKNPIKQNGCKECGHVTDLKDMKELYVDCECGAKFKYLTNADDPTITMECYKCGTPIDLEHNRKHNTYQTMK